MDLSQSLLSRPQSEQLNTTLSLPPRNWPLGSLHALGCSRPLGYLAGLKAGTLRQALWPPTITLPFHSPLITNQHDGNSLQRAREGCWAHRDLMAKGPG